MTDLFRLAWQSFHVPKAGNTLDEYEDAFAGDPQQGRFAIADGASESAFADAWAQIVVKAFVQTPGRWSRWLDAARQRWRAQVQERELPWYAEAKFEDGAYAAVLGIAFKNGRWRARAVGDCCLFQMRGQRLLRSFPIEHAADFGNRPSLLGSRSRQTAQPRARRFHATGDLHATDAVLLMTDALAQWFLQQVEEGRQPWDDLQAILTEEQFSSFVADLRAAKQLRNDDVTLVSIHPENS
jgi:hypothetical protein